MGEGGIASISKDEDGIPRYVRARLTVITLLLSRLEATKYAKMDLELSFDTFFVYFITMDWRKRGSRIR